MPAGDYISSGANAMAPSPDASTSDRESHAPDQPDLLSSWEAAWIDLGGEG